jgi:hypothetical protein
VLDNRFNGLTLLPRKELAGKGAVRCSTGGIF